MKNTREYQTTQEEDLALAKYQVTIGLAVAEGVMNSPEYVPKDKELAKKAYDAFKINSQALEKGLMRRYSDEDLEGFDEHSMECLKDGNYLLKLTRNMYERPLMEMVFKVSETLYTPPASTT